MAPITHSVARLYTEAANKHWKISKVEKVMKSGFWVRLDRFLLAIHSEKIFGVLIFFPKVYFSLKTSFCVLIIAKTFLYYKNLLSFVQKDKKERKILKPKWQTKGYLTFLCNLLFFCFNVETFFVFADNSYFIKCLRVRPGNVD